MKRFPLIALAIALSLSPVRSALLVYEGFDYPAGTENPGAEATGGTKEGTSLTEGGTGLAAPKLPSDRVPLSVSESGLSFEDGSYKLAVRGNAALAPEGTSAVYKFYTPQSGDPFEALRSDIDSDAFGKTGKTLWFSFLMKLEGDITTSTVATLKLGKAHMALGVCNNEKSDAPYIRVSGPRSNVAAESGRTYLIVGRIDYGDHSSPEARTDSVEVWVDPSLGTNDPGRNADMGIKETQETLNDFWIEFSPGGSGVKAFFDEFRVGESYEDVTPFAR